MKRGRRHRRGENELKRTGATPPNPNCINRGRQRSRRLNRRPPRCRFNAGKYVQPPLPVDAMFTLDPRRPATAFQPSVLGTRSLRIRQLPTRCGDFQAALEVTGRSPRCTSSMPPLPRARIAAVSARVLAKARVCAVQTTWCACLARMSPAGCLGSRRRCHRRPGRCGAASGRAPHDDPSVSSGVPFSWRDPGERGKVHRRASEPLRAAQDRTIAVAPGWRPAASDFHGRNEICG